jgi:hypothetical protein
MKNDHFDVIIIGGGPAGLAAAMQAGHGGLRVLLIEKSGVLGGTTTLSGVNFPGLFHAWGKQVIAGYGWELTKRAVMEGGGSLPDFADWRRHHWLLQIPVNIPLYAALADEMIAAAGAHTLFHAMCFSGKRRNENWILDVAVKEGGRKFSAPYLLDCTGDANVAALLGFPLRQNQQRQPATLIFKLGGYDPSELNYESLQKSFDAECHAGRLDPGFIGGREDGIRPFLENHGQNKMHVTGGEASSSSGKSEVEKIARSILLKLFRFLRCQPGLQGLRIEHLAMECGIRETRTLAGEVTITEEDYLTGRMWPDSLCHSFYPVDIHKPDGDGIDIRPLPEGIVPTVPLAAMMPQQQPGVNGQDHFLVAGRCVSSDQAANSALRVQASCMAMGQAAAAAVVVAARRNTGIRCAEAEEIRTLLRGHGAITPGA